MPRRRKPAVIKPLSKKALADITLSATQRAVIELLYTIGRPLTNEGLAYRLTMNEHPITEARMRTVRKEMVDQDLLVYQGRSDNRATLWNLTATGRSLAIALREAQPVE